MNLEEEKVYFTPGMRVKCKQLDNAPEMYVLYKKELTFKNKENSDKILQGIVCRWFSTDNKVQEAVFNTKDLTRI